MYKSPTSRKTYWDIVNACWEDIRHIMDLHLPTFGNKWIDGTPLDKTLGEYIEELRIEQNPKLVRAFNSAWWNCPEENSGEWAHKSWNEFYVLCSEEWCLFEEREELDD